MKILTITIILTSTIYNGLIVYKSEFQFTELIDIEQVTPSRQSCPHQYSPSDSEQSPASKDSAGDYVTKQNYCCSVIFPLGCLTISSGKAPSPPR